MTNITIQIPDASTIEQLVQNNLHIPSINVALEQLQSLNQSAHDALTTATAGVADTISEVQGQIQSVLGGVTSAIGNVEQATQNLQDQMTSALQTLHLDPGAFAQQIATIQSNFPSANVASILSQVQSGTLNIAIDVPNIELVAGQEIQRAITPLLAQLAPEGLPSLPEIPTITIPDLPTFQIVDISTLAVSANNLTLAFQSAEEELNNRLGRLRALI